MKSVLCEKAIKMRVEQELSYGTIQKKLDVSKSTLSYWLRDYPLSEKRILELRRKGWKKGEASRERFRNTMRRKKEKNARAIYNLQLRQFRTLSKKNLFIAGLMLYYAEGDKRNYSRIMLSNTDPVMINFFIWWLKEFLGIPRSKIKVQLHLYENMDIAKERKFWQDILVLDTNQFYKIMVRKVRKSSFTYSYSHNHGTCSLYALGVENKMRLSMSIKAFLDSIHTSGV